MSGWMIHALAVSAVVTAAAIAAEGVLRLWGRQARFVWSAAMVVSVGLPALSLAQSLGWLPRVGDMTAVAAVLSAPLASVVLPAVNVGAATSWVDTVAGALWLLASVALLARFFVAARALHRRRRGWRQAVVDGESLLVSPDAGPAVIGVRRPSVVIPEWVLELDASLRALVLRHEREHLDHGDPRLLLSAGAFAVAAPWNLALWYQLYRLRSAMEIDCDLRVLRAHPDVRRYGSLLLAVAQRADRSGLLAPALIESNSLLSRRIVAMRRSVPPHRATRSLVLVAAAAALAMVACQMDGPGEPTGKVEVGPAVMPGEKPFFEFQVEKPVVPAPASSTPRYPDALRLEGVEGDVLAQFVVDTAGRAEVSSFKVLKSSNDQFTEAVKNALPLMRFVPAEVGARKVRQLVQQPFTFSITR
jgi:TonB family protein